MTDEELRDFVPGLANVPAAESSVCYLDGSIGKLQYRGSVNQAERSRKQPNPRTTDIYRQTDGEGEREES